MNKNQNPLCMIECHLLYAVIKCILIVAIVYYAFLMLVAHDYLSKYISCM